MCVCIESGMQLRHALQFCFVAAWQLTQQQAAYLAHDRPVIVVESYEEEEIFKIFKLEAKL